MSLERFYIKLCDKNVKNLLNDKDLLNIKFTIKGKITEKSKTFSFNREAFFNKSGISSISLTIEISEQEYNSLNWLHLEQEYQVKTIMTYRDYFVREKVQMKCIEREILDPALIPNCYCNGIDFDPALISNHYGIDFYYDNFKSFSIKLIKSEVIWDETIVNKNSTKTESFTKENEPKGFFASLAECYYESI